MRFHLIDQVLLHTDDRIVAVKNITAGEEYLQDHFPSFPVMPGVLMIETLIQAARRLLGDSGGDRLVLSGVRALKYGTFVRPGDALRVEVELLSRDESDASVTLKGVGRVQRPAGAADAPAPGEEAPISVSGRFVMRPARVS